MSEDPHRIQNDAVGADVGNFEQQIFTPPPRAFQENCPPLQYALQYAARGWSVLPLHSMRNGQCSCGNANCTSPAKHPRTRRGEKDASNDREQIESWCRLWPDANVGIATGPSGLVVLDIDGPEGQAELGALISKYGVLPRTLAACTGREGGLHLYYAGAVPSGQEKGRHIDIRGTSGYVVAPPSNHATGRTYAWINPGAAVATVSSMIEGLAGGSSFRTARQQSPHAETAARDAQQSETAQAGLDLGPKPEWLKNRSSPGVAEKIRTASLPAWSPQEEERLRSALHTIPANIRGREWSSYGRVLHELKWIVSGCDRGFEIWNDWSETSTGKGPGNGEYKGRKDLEKRWRHFEESSSEYTGRRITIGSIYKHAQTLGWTPPHCDGTSETGEQVHQPREQENDTNAKGQHDQTDHRGHHQRQQEQAGQSGEEGENNAQSRKIDATPFEAFEFAKIPKRQWLYGRHYVRGYVTATVAPGGGAKTAKELAEAVSMAVGRDLLDDNKAIERLRVWYWNGEDSRDEINRRIAAICLHYKIDPKVLEGWLFVDSGHAMPICLATENRGQINFDEAVINSLHQTIGEKNIDLVIFDPFIAIHKVTENNNPVIDQVVKTLGRIANRNNCAIEIVHHVRKPSQGQYEITAHDTRGGGAIVDAVRSCQVLNRMTKKEAQQTRIKEDECFRYFRVDSGKQNLAPPEKAKWRRLQSIELPNGDNVQVVEFWHFPEAVNSVTEEEMEFVRATAQKGIYNRWDSRAKFWIGRALADQLGMDPKNGADRRDIYAKLSDCLKNGWIAVIRRKDGNRREREYVIPGPAKSCPTGEMGQAGGVTDGQPG